MNRFENELQVFETITLFQKKERKFEQTTAGKKIDWT